MTDASSAPATPDLKAIAGELRREIDARVLPYWVDTTVDRERGGYVLNDLNGDAPDLDPDANPSTKAVVTQARLVWGFAHVARHGFTAGGRDLVAAARHGYRFLIDRMWDPVHGGFLWALDRDGQVVNDRKHVYGQAFAIYALVEFARASGEREPLDHALAAFRLLEDRARDRRHPGWREDFTRDWQPMTDPASRRLVDTVGLKSANSHLHLMEAFAELAEATGDAGVRAALEEAVRINQQHCYPTPETARFVFTDDWTPAGRAGISYGHNVEYAWLLLRSEEVLGRAPSAGILARFLDHALAHGYDHARGGLYNLGPASGPATDTDKVWWAQAELLAALADGVRFLPRRADCPRLLAQTLAFARRHLVVGDRDAVWIDTAAADGTPRKLAKAHAWKGNYHDLRGLVKVIQVGEAAGG